MLNRLSTVLLFCVWLVGFESSQAGSGSKFGWPTGGVKNKSGLTIEVDTRWLDGSGYRPVRVRVRNSNGTANMADRTLRLEIRPFAWQWGGQQDRTVAYLEFPQGAKTAETWVPIRQGEIWGRIELQTFEDGARLKDLSGQQSLGPTTQSAEWTESFPSVLFIDKDMPDLDMPSGRRALSSNKGNNVIPDARIIGTLFPDNAYYDLPSNKATGQNARDRITPISDLDLLKKMSRFARYALRNANDLPENWILYSCCDFIMISLEDAKDMEANHPEKWKAILKHTGSGATLVVTGIGDYFEYLNELENLCN